MTPYRVAVIGTGGIAGAHVAAARHAGERVELVGAVDIDAGRLAAFCDQHAIAERFTDAGQLLADARPDLVLIATPPRTHFDLIIQALETGAWVVCEKPLVASLAEFDQVTAAEQRTGRYVSTVFQWRFGSGAQHLKRLIAAGELGQSLVGVCQTLWYRGPDYYAVPWRGRWETEIGGTTVIHGIHLIDLMLWLLGGDWQEVRAVIDTLDRDIEDEDVSLATVRFASGALVSVTTSALSPRQESYLRLDFQRATVEVRALYAAGNEHWRYSLPDGSPDGDALPRWAQIAGDFPGDHRAQLAAVLDSMDRHERPPVSGPEARRILEFVASLYKAAFTGNPVRHGTIMPGDPFYESMHGGHTIHRKRGNAG